MPRLDDDVASHARYSFGFDWGTIACAQDASMPAFDDPVRSDLWDQATVRIQS